MGSLRRVDEVAADIRSLKIQGARRIARAALEALASAATLSKAKHPSDLYNDLLKAAHALEATRPTEPMMRNALEDCLRHTLIYARTHPSGEVGEIVRALVEHQRELLEDMQAAGAKIAKFGAAEIPPGAHVMVHCHSSTLMATLIEAHKMGKGLEVTCLETRPLFQGRLSARELAAAGLPVRLAVDSAAGSLMDKMDVVMVGADAITAEGDLVNKIGTHTLAQLAFAHSVKFLCTAELFKYDPLTRWGRAEPIEQRDISEVWEDGRYARESAAGGGMDGPVLLPKGVQVHNPAFDRTPARLIFAYVTEEGLVPPRELAHVAERRIKKAMKTR